MDVIKWLQDVRKMDERINAKLAERQRLVDLAENTSSKPLDGMPFSNTGLIPRTMEDAVINIVMLDHEIDRLTDEYIDHRRKVIKALKQLPQREYRVMYDHYIKYMPWKEVAQTVGYSTTHVWRIKQNAVAILCQGT